MKAGKQAVTKDSKANKHSGLCLWRKGGRQRVSAQQAESLCPATGLLSVGTHGDLDNGNNFGACISISFKRSHRLTLGTCGMRVFV